MATDPESAIRVLDETFVRNIAARDAGALVDAFYADEAELLPPDRPAISGKERIADYWNAMLQAGLRSVTLNTTRIEISADMAFTTGQYALTIATDDVWPRHCKGKYLATLRL